MFEDVEWSEAGEHMFSKHHVTTGEADEALQDPDRIMIVPDYNSKSGRNVRIIGYSHTAGTLITVLALEFEGIEYGVNGWYSNSKDRAIYTRGVDVSEQDQ